MAAAVASTAAMEAIATVEAFTAMEPAVAAAEAFMAIVSTASVVTAVSVVAVAIVAATTVEAATIVTTAVVATVEPGAGADEDAADEVVRAIVAVWSACVRIVAVVTVGADRRRAVDGAHSNGHANLGVGAARGEKQNSQQCNIF